MCVKTHPSKEESNAEGLTAPCQSLSASYLGGRNEEERELFDSLCQFECKNTMIIISVFLETTTLIIILILIDVTFNHFLVKFDGFEHEFLSLIMGILGCRCVMCPPWLPRDKNRIMAIKFWRLLCCQYHSNYAKQQMPSQHCLPATRGCSEIWCLFSEVSAAVHCERRGLYHGNAASQQELIMFRQSVADRQFWVLAAALLCQSPPGVFHQCLPWRHPVPHSQFHTLTLLAHWLQGG